MDGFTSGKGIRRRSAGTVRRSSRRRFLHLEALERRELLAADLLTATTAEGFAAADASAAWMAGAEGEGSGALAQVRLRVVDNVPASDTGPANRTDLTTVSPGDTLRVEVLLKDLRTDDGDGDDSKDNFGVFASYVDLEFAAEAFSIPSIPPAAFENLPGAPVLSVPVSYKNPNFLSGLGTPSADLVQYRYPNAPVAGVSSIPGVVNNLGSFLDGTTPIGTNEFFQVDIQFTVESLTAADDDAVVYAGVPNQRIDVLANDALIEGRQWFVPASHRAHGALSSGNEMLLFGYTGYDSEDPLDTDPEGVVVPPALVDRLADYVDVVNPGTLQIDSFTQPAIGTISLNPDGTLGFAPNASAVPVASSAFTYTASDGMGNTRSATVTLTVPLVNMFTVNSTGDGVDVNPGDGVAQDASGNTTLRAAIQEANALANLADGPDVILFDIPGVGPHTIQPTSALPTITQPVVIDATTEPDFAGTPVIELDGSNAGVGAVGISVTSGASTVRGLAINRFSGNGLNLLLAGGNVVEGNYIGLDVGGTLDRGNSGHGVFINGPENSIGGSSAAARNVISGNDRQGIYIIGTAAEYNSVTGNYLGTNAAGSAAVANGTYGVWLAAANNQVGGSQSGQGNVISGNLAGGVYVIGSTATGNQIIGNRIGTDSDGDVAVMNRGAGVLLASAPSNTVRDNQVSGNLRQGVYALGSTGTDNMIVGNLIGTNAAGDAALGNNDHGVYLTSANNRVGGTGAGDGNLISGNAMSGVAAFFGAASGNVIQGNWIGTDFSGKAKLPNSAFGVDIRLVTGVTVGGVEANAGNVISGNQLAGVLIAGDTAANNKVLGNWIGTDVTGTNALGNSWQGVLISDASNNIIGCPDGGNIISGNIQQGVYILGGLASDNIVQSNQIGTDVTGTTSLPNGRYGVWIASANTLVGGAQADEGNLISGNNWGGIYVIYPTATGNRIQGNRIGTNVAGNSALPNNGAGVLLSAGAIANTVGGTGAEGNTIAWNTAQGVYVVSENSMRNVIQGNSIFENAAWGIDLRPYGLTPNDVDDPDTGPNQFQNYPEISLATAGATELTVQYAIPSVTPNSAYPFKIEFFLADIDGQEGQTLIGTDIYAAPGLRTIALPECCLTAGTRIVATATDADGNTSEFSPNVTVTAP